MMPKENRLPIEVSMMIHDLTALFPRGTSQRILDQVRSACIGAPSEHREGVERSCKDASAFLNHLFYDNAFARDGDMDLWFAAQECSLLELSGMGRARREAFEASNAAKSDADLEREQQQEWDEEAEEERVRDVESVGGYGRTHRYSSDMERWVYVRFGELPSNGVSRFGLAGEDTEDGPDQWRAESGGKTHESGISVLRAMRHPTVPGALVVLPPDDTLALYGVPSFDAYLLSIVPVDCAEMLVLDGSLRTIKGRDGTVRAELGSDGEYLVDAKTIRGMERHPIEKAWISERAPLSEVLSRRERGFR